MPVRRPLSGAARSGLAAAVRARLAAEGLPPVWSLIATVFGDIVLPRGGTLSTASLIRILDLVGVAPPAIRTALSRLVADGWLVGGRDGRRSHYRMTEAAEAESRRASERIYALPASRFNGRFQIVLLVHATAAARQTARGRLIDQGFGALQSDCFIRPARAGGQDAPAPPGELRFIDAVTDAATAAAAVSAAFDVPALAERHRRFADANARLMAAAASAGKDPAAALAARLLLIHGYRRLALRDPGLPTEFMPSDLGRRPLARAVGAAYAALLPASEAWLDAHADSGTGPLPQAAAGGLGHGRFVVAA
jgi:phenylacetic acid degradation operon negative regulatory protein